MKKFFICLAICFSFLFIGNVSASINTTSGSFPDLPSGYENSDFIIILRNNGSYGLFLWNTGVHEVDGGGTLNFYTSSYDRSTSVRIYNLSNNRWSYSANTGNYAYSYNTLIATTTKIYARKHFDTLIHDSGYGLINNNIFTVNFHLNGGAVWDMSNLLDPHLITEDYSIQTTTDELSEYLTHLTPIKDYSNFIGWYYDSEFTEPYSSINNLLDISQGYQNGYISSSNEFKSHPQTALFNQKIYLESGKTYTFSTKSNVCNMVISLYDSNDNFLGRTKKENTNNIVYTAGNNVSYVRFAVNIDDDTITEQKINNAEIIVEEGSTRTEISNVISNDINLYAKFELYDYLQGYKRIDLTTDDRYYMLSDISSGSVFIPKRAFDDYGGRLSYYDNDLSSQPYTSYIQDYVTTPDDKFVRQDFNLSDYTGADWVMFSKYIYLEGEDDISYTIFVPDSSYDSSVTITPNSSGGNQFDFKYKDSNGDIQEGQVNSADLSQTSPLLGNFFNDFSSNTFGLTSIITAPLSLIQSLSSTSCTPLNLPLPFVGGTLTLPCMYDFYSNTFGVLFTLYQTITFGIVAYWVSVRIFNMVKDFKNPDHDEIEVMDL